MERFKDHLGLTVSVIAAVLLAACGSTKAPDSGDDSTSRQIYDPIQGVGAALTGDPGIGVIAFHEGGERLAAMTALDANGSIANVTGAIWTSPDDEVVSIFFGTDGLPARVVYESTVAVFSNYTESTVDIAVLTNGVVTEVHRQVALDPAVLSDLRAVVSGGTSDSGELVYVSHMLARDRGMIRTLKWITLATKLVACALAAATSGPIALIPCSSALLTAVSLVVDYIAEQDPEGITNMAFGISLVGCTTSAAALAAGDLTEGLGALECISLITEYMARQKERALEVVQVEAPAIQQAEVTLASQAPGQIIDATQVQIRYVQQAVGEPEAWEETERTVVTCTQLQDLLTRYAYSPDTPVHWLYGGPEASTDAAYYGYHIALDLAVANPPAGIVFIATDVTQTCPTLSLAGAVQGSGAETAAVTVYAANFLGNSMEYGYLSDEPSETMTCADIQSLGVPFTPMAVGEFCCNGRGQNGWLNAAEFLVVENSGLGQAWLFKRAEYEAACGGASVPQPASSGAAGALIVAEADDFIFEYFDAITNQDFARAWASVTQDFRNYYNDNSFDNYVSGFREQNLCRITVSDAQIKAETAAEAEVWATVTYYRDTGCNAYPNYFRFFFLSENGVWKLNRVKYQ
ncbi:MAG: hypothetical protein IT326_01375 [Anaerolineae bacterium]|nr:hypothetical protein [Anaerolineae bacterium]